MKNNMNRIIKITVMLMMANLLLTGSASAQTMYVGDTYNYNGQSITLLSINSLHAPYSVNLDVAGYAYTVPDNNYFYASVINADIYISQTSLFSTVMLVLPRDTGVWSVDATVSGDSVAINYCVGSSGGYYRLKSSTNTILRSELLGANVCRSYSESKSYLYSLESGNWIAYVTDLSDTTKAFRSFSVDPTVPPTPPPTVTPTPYPTYTPPPTPQPTYTYPTPPPTPPPTPQPTSTPPITCPEGLVWDGTKCVVYAPPGNDNLWMYWIAGIAGFGAVVYLVTRKTKKGRR